MNYRHGYHAGNFADLAKHAAVLAFLKRLREEAVAIRVIDTHAGAGGYDLSDATFARSKEAEAGIKHLLGTDVPLSLKPLADYVRGQNKREGFKGSIGMYPGSPLLITDYLRPEDDYVGCELRDDDVRILRSHLKERFGIRKTDGYEFAATLEPDDKALFLLIDPPFERSDDYERIVETMEAVLKHTPDARALIWLPLKDLETFDRFLRHMEAVLKPEDEGPDVLVCELRLRPLWNPMKMNGCALVSLNAPAGFADDMIPLSEDVVAVFGEDGGKARVWNL
jgi:23S rRNA (adenine2030-N6)-methyltransferase